MLFLPIGLFLAMSPENPWSLELLLLIARIITAPFENCCYDTPHLDRRPPIKIINRFPRTTSPPPPPPLSVEISPYRHIFAAMNRSADPCQDFYNFACGNFNQTNVAQKLQLTTLQLFAGKLQSGDYLRETTPLPLQQLTSFHRQCIASHSNNNVEATDDVQRLLNQIFRRFHTYTGITFPMLTMPCNGVPLPRFNSTQLGKILGYMAGRESTQALISFKIDANLTHPTVSEEEAKTAMLDMMKPMARLFNVNLDRESMEQDIEDILEVDRFLGDGIYDRFFDYDIDYSIPRAQLDFPFIDWPTYLSELLVYAPASVRQRLRDGTILFSITNRRNLKRLETFGMTKFTGRQLANYFNYRLLDDHFPLCALGNDVPDTHMLNYHRYRRHKADASTNFVMSTFPLTSLDEDSIEITCAREASAHFHLAAARVVVDVLAPRLEQRNTLVDVVKEIFKQVTSIFRETLLTATWLSPVSRVEAINKLNKIVPSIGFPKAAVDDNALVQFYEGLNLTTGDSYAKMVEKIGHFRIRKEFAKLSATNGGDRDEFRNSVLAANALYQPRINAIEVPLGYLQSPLVDVSWPASLNYGGIGATAGHELMHAFDSHSIQFDGDGALRRWMDIPSLKGYEMMKMCVVAEYEQFCTQNANLTSASRKSCIDAVKTLAENIADIGGTAAAFRAYRKAIEKQQQQQPRLVMTNDGEQFTHDQLFFMNFAYGYCDNAETATTLTSDVHSPEAFRVLGTLRNNRDFRKAFHCREGSKYAPSSYMCDVWN